MQLTQEQRENISQLIRSDSMHELGMQQAKLFGYDKECEWEYRLDYWYSKSNTILEGVTFIPDLEDVTVDIGKYISCSVIYDWDDGSLSLVRCGFDFKGYFSIDMATEIFDLSNRLIEDKKLLQFASMQDNNIKIDTKGIKDYIFEVIKQNQAIFDKYIDDVVA